MCSQGFVQRSAVRIWHCKVVRARLVALECHSANTLSSVIVCRGSRYSGVQLFIYAQVHSASVASRAELRFSALIWDHSTREYRITRVLPALLLTCTWYSFCWESRCMLRLVYLFKSSWSTIGVLVIHSLYKLCLFFALEKVVVRIEWFARVSRMF